MESNHPRKGFADPCLPTWLPRLNSSRFFYLYAQLIVYCKMTKSNGTLPSGFYYFAT
jgi:hypothetical protein